MGSVETERVSRDAGEGGRPHHAHTGERAGRCGKASERGDGCVEPSVEQDEDERERADALMAELLKMTADAMAAKEAAARLEGGQVRLRQELSDVHSDRDAWRSDVERLILIEYRRNERERLPWWKRLAGMSPNSPKSPLLSAPKAA